MNLTIWGKSATGAKVWVGDETRRQLSQAGKRLEGGWAEVLRGQKSEGPCITVVAKCQIESFFALDGISMCLFIDSPLF